MRLPSDISGPKYVMTHEVSYYDISSPVYIMTHEVSWYDISDPKYGIMTHAVSCYHIGPTSGLMYIMTRGFMVWHIRFGLLVFNASATARVIPRRWNDTWDFMLWHTGSQVRHDTSDFVYVITHEVSCGHIRSQVRYDIWGLMRAAEVAL